MPYLLHHLFPLTSLIIILYSINIRFLKNILILLVTQELSPLGDAKRLKSFSTVPYKFLYGTLIYTLLIVVSTFVALFAVKNIKISPDSMIYALISQEILSGNGIRLPINLRMENEYVFINGTVPYLEQPPLFPLFLAILGGVTPHNLFAAQLLNLICHVVISIFTFLSILKIYDNKCISLIGGILVSISFPLLRVTHHLWSEPLFIALTTATIYFLILSRNSSKRSKLSFFIASICAGFAILTRYAGIALIPLFFWEGYVLLRKNRNLNLKNAFTLLTTLLPLLITGALLIYNYIISGTIFGWNPPPPERSYTDALIGTIKMLFLQFPLGKHSIILIIIFTILFILYIIVNTDFRRELAKYGHGGMDLIILFIMSYIVVISFAMAKSQTVFELRYMSPSVPFLFMIGIVIIASFWEMVRHNGFYKLSLYGLIFSLGILILGNGYKTYLRIGEFFYKQTQHYSILKSSAFNWIKEHYNKNTIIATNRPFHLSFFGGYSTIALPHKRFNPNIHIPDNMESVLPEKMFKSGSQVLALFDNAEERYDGKYIAKLFNNRVSDRNFRLVYESNDGVVYELKNRK